MRWVNKEKERAIHHRPAVREGRKIGERKRQRKRIREGDKRRTMGETENGRYLRR